MFELHALTLFNKVIGHEVICNNVAVAPTSVASAIPGTLSMPQTTMFANPLDRRVVASLLVVTGLCTLGATCGSTPSDDTDTRNEPDATDASSGDTTDTDTLPGPPDAEDDPGVDARITHRFETFTLGAGRERVPCLQWTLNNEEPIYVNTVTLANSGGFHHSNWFVAPEDYAAGEDGYFDCDERGFSEITAASKGTVLFAQSTQARSERQSFADGAVIKIPPNHKIVADVHFLNIADHERDFEARLSLGLTHPRRVDTVVTPFRMTYYDLEIPPETESRFSGECDIREKYESFTGESFDWTLYYLLPHYHELGNYFGVEIMGGPRDGENIFELQGFDAEANGKVFDPPLDLGEADGIRFTCGYNNPRDELVEWGLGGQEMCVLLGFADGDALVDASVNNGTELTSREGGIVRHEGPCTTLTLPRADSQSPPTEEEKEGEMYVPESSDSEDLDPIPDCEDTPASAEPLKPPTLANLKKDVFSVSCAFSSCHGRDNPVADLRLAGDDVHGQLVDRQPSLTPTDMPLVDPGNPEGSWLYRVTSECRPEAGGRTVSHMPKNSPTLLEPELVAMIREWIERGAPSN